MTRPKEDEIVTGKINQNIDLLKAVTVTFYYKIRL